MRARARRVITGLLLGAVATLGLTAASSSPRAAAATTATVVQTNAPTPIYGNVQVHGSGFTPYLGVTFRPCDIEDPVTWLVCVDSPPYGSSVVADAAGEFDFFWPASLAGDERWTFVQWTSAGGSGPAFVTPIVYDPMDQSIAIRQRIPYAGGQIVDLDGSRWPPRQGVLVLHCSSGGCVHPSVTPGAQVSAAVGFDGSFTTPVRLRRFVRGVDCYAARCWLSAGMGWPADRTEDLDLVMARPGWTAAVGYYNFADEGDPFGCAPVILTKVPSENIVVEYRSFDIDAKVGVDHIGAAGSLMIPAGQRLGCAQVNLFDDREVEGVEMIGVHLERITGPAVLVDGGRDSYIFLRDDD